MTESICYMSKCFSLSGHYAILPLKYTFNSKWGWGKRQSSIFTNISFTLDFFLALCSNYF